MYTVYTYGHRAFIIRLDSQQHIGFDTCIGLHMKLRAAALMRDVRVWLSVSCVDSAGMCSNMPSN